ncbi:DDE superfamily endonuclease [Popillia japonica]|uniref:DDE superfamily endonuclease n=1 Tax=Popillia japonica TaxID=7064 RepID=A0AAW1JUQ3_POPJA
MDLLEDLHDILDNDIVNYVNRNRRPYKTRSRYTTEDNFNKYDDTEFISRYRLSKETVFDLLRLIEHRLVHHSNRNNPIPPLQQHLITLRFYATGSFYITIGDFGVIHKSTVCKIIHKVTRAICTLRPRYVSRFPRVLGAVYGTHVCIQSPGGDNAELFRNRKGYFSINTQVIADANYVIRDIVGRWPGSAHDANIFENSSVKMGFENNEFGNGLLLRHDANIFENSSVKMGFENNEFGNGLLLRDSGYPKYNRGSPKQKKEEEDCDTEEFR